MMRCKGSNFVMEYGKEMVMVIYNAHYIGMRNEVKGKEEFTFAKLECRRQVTTLVTNYDFW